MVKKEFGKLAAIAVISFLVGWFTTHPKETPTKYTVFTSSDVPLFDGKPHVLGDAERNFYIFQYDAQHQKLLIDMLIIGDDQLPITTPTPPGI